MIILVVLTILIKLFSLFPAVVETYYTNGVYPWIGFVQRLMFGWIPFSIGDLLYAFAGMWLIFKLIKFVRVIKRKKADKKYLLHSAASTLKVGLYVYVVFNLLWGLNYNRYGIDYQMKIESTDYDSTDLAEVTRRLAMQMNKLQPASVHTRNNLYSKQNLFDGAFDAYHNLRKSSSIFSYNYPSIKPSIYSYLGNYMGFTGYYNPFTGEAQVNTTVPVFIRPFTSCHEIGHQLGYAKESEANFAAYLSGTASDDPAFQYSIYFEMYAYAARYLYYSDSIALKSINAQLSPAVKDDIRTLRNFLKKYDNPFETAIDRLYSQYLKANEQPSGKMSYNEVVGMLIAYYKKTGKI